MAGPVSAADVAAAVVAQGWLGKGTDEGSGLEGISSGLWTRGVAGINLGWL